MRFPMNTEPAKPGRASPFSSPAWIVIAIIITGGLFLFVWLFFAARRVLPRDAHALVWLLPLGAMLWVGGATFMARGMAAPTIPGETGNPLFLAGFILAALCLTLMFVFNNLFTRGLAHVGERSPIFGRVVWFTLCAVGFLLSQLIIEITPVAPQNRDILAVFQFLCLMAGSVTGIQFVERVHAAASARPGASSAAITTAASERTAQRL